MAVKDKNSAVVLSVFKGSYILCWDNHSHKITAAAKVQQKQLTKDSPISISSEHAAGSHVPSSKASIGFLDHDRCASICGLYCFATTLPRCWG